MSNASITITVACDAQMKAFYKATRSTYKLQKEMLTMNRNKLPFYRFLAIWILNNKIEKIESKISVLNDKIKKLKKNGTKR
jgi:hypothetical protein